MKPTPQQGDIYWADLDPIRGREQRGKRPVLVISRNELNRLPLTVLIMAGTGAERVTEDYPSDIRVTSAEAPLPKNTVFMGLQIRSIDPARLGERIGSLPTSRVPEIWTVVRYVIGDDRAPDPEPEET